MSVMRRTGLRARVRIQSGKDKTLNHEGHGGARRKTLALAAS